MQLVLMPDKNLTRSAVILIRLNPVRTGLMGADRSVPWLRAQIVLVTITITSAMSAPACHCCCNIKRSVLHFAVIDNEFAKGNGCSSII